MGRPSWYIVGGDICWYIDRDFDVLAYAPMSKGEILWDDPLRGPVDFDAFDEYLADTARFVESFLRGC